MSLIVDLGIPALVASIVTWFLKPLVDRWWIRREAVSSHRVELIRIYSEVANRIEAVKRSLAEPEDGPPGVEFAAVPRVAGAFGAAQEYDPDLPEIERIGQRLLEYLFGTIDEYEPEGIGNEHLLQGVRAVSRYLRTSRLKRGRRRQLLGEARQHADRLRIELSGRHRIRLDRAELDRIAAMRASAIVRADDEDHRRLRRGDWAELVCDDQMVTLRIIDVSRYWDLETLFQGENATTFDPDTAAAEQLQALQRLYPPDPKTGVIAVHLDLSGLRA